ncbi:hypothetical protein AB0C18_18675 [Nonomuraea muscovyensis]|uniref:hypothetical protein n=1 Tax=Nonomuraea muscovyensis TaxID=1124761 RepID=UPI0033D0C0EC
MPAPAELRWAGGFVVEGGDSGARFLIACTDDEAECSAQELTRCQVDLGKAGYPAQRHRAR